jgi:DNA invertase Pin-like site-specific DNA recombinase
MRSKNRCLQDKSISSDDPRLGLQRKALTAAGCGDIFEERGSGKRVRYRFALRRALAACAGGDVLIVWRLDLLGRSAAHIIEILHNLAAGGVGVHSLTDAIDMTVPDAALALRLVHALAEFQRRTMTRGDRGRLGPSGAPKGVRKAARPGSRRPKLTPHQICEVIRRREQGETLRDIARSCNVHPSTISRLTA